MNNGQINNPYTSGDYYAEVYSPTDMDLAKSMLWMSNYYKVIKTIFPTVSEYKNKRILEIGSSFGGFIGILNKEGYTNVTASDLFQGIFPRDLKNDFLIVDLLQEVQDSAKNVWDMVFAFDVMEHVADTGKAIESLGQLLADDGLFIFFTPYPLRKHLTDPYHVNMQYPNYYTNIFRQRGFQLLQVQNVSFVPYFWRFGLSLFVKKVFESRLCISGTFYVFKKIKT